MTEHDLTDVAAPTGAALPTHPGHLLRDVVLPEVSESKTELASRLGVSRRTFYDLLNGEQGVTPEMALKLGKLFGNSAEFWTNMQAAHDLAKARLALADQLKAIEPVRQPSADQAPTRPDERIVAAGRMADLEARLEDSFREIRELWEGMARAAATRPEADPEATRAARMASEAIEIGESQIKATLAALELGRAQLQLYLGRDAGSGRFVERGPRGGVRKGALRLTRSHKPQT